MGVSSYFRDRTGRQTVFLPPNLPILAWAGLGTASAMALTPRYRNLLRRASQGAMMNYPSEMTHASVKGTELAVPENLLRLSVGIEDIEDLIADLDQAVKQL